MSIDLIMVAVRDFIQSEFRRNNRGADKPIDGDDGDDDVVGPDGGDSNPGNAR